MDRYPDVYLGTGLVAENHARESSISREEQDAFALRSHQRALAAIESGRFSQEIVPVTATLIQGDGNGRGPKTRQVTFAIDEGPRRDTSAEALAKLRPAFHPAARCRRQLLPDERRRRGGDCDVRRARAHRGPHPAGAVRDLCDRRRRAERFGIGPVPAIRKASSWPG